MPRLLNLEHELFCRYYVSGPYAGSYVDAYEAAGYERDTGNASRLASQPDVVARIAELQKGELAIERHELRSALAGLGVDRAMLARHYAAIVRANPLDYYVAQADGSVQAHLPNERAKAMALREVVIEPARGDSKHAVKLRLKFYDKLRALEKLDKLIAFAQELPEPPSAAPLNREQRKESLVARLRDWAEVDGDDAVAQMALQAIKAARPQTWRAAEVRERRIAAARAEAEQAAAAAEQAAAAAAAEPVARPEQSENRDEQVLRGEGSVPDVAAFDPGDQPANSPEPAEPARSDAPADLVVTGLVPVIPLREALCPSKRDGGDEPGHEELDKCRSHDSPSCHSGGDAPVARLEQGESRDQSGHDEVNDCRSHDSPSCHSSDPPDAGGGFPPIPLPRQRDGWAWQ